MVNVYTKKGIALCSLLEELNDFTHLLICGDFNMKDINWSNMSVNPGNAHVESFIDTIQDLFLFQHIQEPTRFRPGTTPSLLNLVFTNEANMINHIDYLPGLGNSDRANFFGTRVINDWNNINDGQVAYII